MDRLFRQIFILYIVFLYPCLGIRGTTISSSDTQHAPNTSAQDDTSSGQKKPNSIELVPQENSFEKDLESLNLPPYAYQILSNQASQLGSKNTNDIKKYISTMSSQPVPIISPEDAKKFNEIIDKYPKLKNSDFVGAIQKISNSSSQTKPPDNHDNQTTQDTLKTLTTSMQKILDEINKKKEDENKKPVAEDPSSTVEKKLTDKLIDYVLKQIMNPPPQSPDITSEPRPRKSAPSDTKHQHDNASNTHSKEGDTGGGGGGGALDMKDIFGKLPFGEGKGGGRGNGGGEMTNNGEKTPNKNNKEDKKEKLDLSSLTKPIPRPKKDSKEEDPMALLNQLKNANKPAAKETRDLPRSPSPKSEGGRMAGGGGGEGGNKKEAEMARMMAEKAASEMKRANGLGGGEGGGGGGGDSGVFSNLGTEPFDPSKYGVVPPFANVLSLGQGYSDSSSSTDSQSNGNDGLSSNSTSKKNALKNPQIVDFTNSNLESTNASVLNPNSPLLQTGEPLYKEEGANVLSLTGGGNILRRLCSQNNKKNTSTTNSDFKNYPIGICSSFNNPMLQDGLGQNTYPKNINTISRESIFGALQKKGLYQ